MPEASISCAFGLDILYSCTDNRYCHIYDGFTVRLQFDKKTKDKYGKEDKDEK